MRISISNIAWEISEDEAVSELLRDHQVDAIDLAPAKYFPNPRDTHPEEVARVRSWWASQGIEIIGMQALLFGTSGLNLFGPSSTQRAMLEHLDSVCRIGAGLGATKLVFGSPRNRDRSGLNDSQARSIGVEFFRRLGDIAQQHRVMICLEPNSAQYTCNFMTTSDETAAVVTAVDHPNIRMQLDTGAVTMNGESVQSVIEQHGSLIGHVHASEPDLKTLGDGEARHDEVAAALRRVLPEQVVTVEMVASKAEPHLEAIRRALGVAIRHYRGPIVSQEPRL